MATIKLTVLVIANFVNNGELNRLRVVCESMDAEEIRKKAMAAYFEAVTDEDEIADLDTLDAWEMAQVNEEKWDEDDCMIVGLIDGHPVSVTQSSENNLSFIISCFEFAKDAEKDAERPTYAPPALAYPYGLTEKTISTEGGHITIFMTGAEHVGRIKAVMIETPRGVMPVYKVSSFWEEFHGSHGTLDEAKAEMFKSYNEKVNKN